MTAAQLALAAYIAGMNLLAFSLYAADKRRARLHMWRIRESTLLAVTVLGGSLGALLGMHLLRHKTKDPKFYLLVPTFFLLHAAVFADMFWRAAGGN